MLRHEANAGPRLREPPNDHLATWRMEAGLMTTVGMDREGHQQRWRELLPLVVVKLAWSRFLYAVAWTAGAGWVLVFAWNPFGRGILSRTKRSLYGILSIFIATQALSRSLPPPLPPIPSSPSRRAKGSIPTNLSGTLFLLARRYESEDLVRITSANTYHETFDSEDILQLTKNFDHPTISNNINLGAKHQFLGFESGDLEPTVVSSQQPQAVDSGTPIQARELPNNETIDPAILKDHASLYTQRIQATENISGITIYPDRCPSERPRIPNKGPPFQCRRYNIKGTRDSDRHSSKIKNRSGARNINTIYGSGRSNKGPSRRKSVSFTTVRAQFSALPVEDRLQFLSWLFEGALSHCVSTPANTDAASVLRCISSQDSDTTYELVDAQRTSRKARHAMIGKFSIYAGL
ncbi:hypothetical protein N7486_010028 [Penicillium sp. IBT 16267x]|nr:hypothetical protein N7486_010028 [Penicillium sp. IBT 16267x]